MKSAGQEVSEFSRQLKLLAKELEALLIAISQLNRGSESRTDKRPQVADLRESGSLEQDADIVMLIYRPDSQESNQERLGEADVIVAKHRGAPPAPSWSGTSCTTRALAISPPPQTSRPSRGRVRGFRPLH